MTRRHESDDWNGYRMDYRDPHRVLEPLERERAVVDKALEALCEAGALVCREYDHGKLAAHRQAVRETFEIPWTAITPRMERLLYSVNAIGRPPVMIAAGIFCGFTFISNAGAAVGPGACYRARDLVGVEIKPEEALRASANVRKVDPTGHARILAMDAIAVVGGYAGEINLLYLDADGTGGRGKGIYLDIVEAAYARMPRGSLVLAHNSVNSAERLKAYLGYVRDPGRFRASVNVVIDREGLEVSVK